VNVGLVALGDSITVGDDGVRPWVSIRR